MKLTTTPTLLLLLLASTSRIHAQLGGESCSVCGDDKEVGDPDGVFEFPGQPAVNCGVLEAAGQSGVIPLAECALIPPFVQDVCGCVDIGGDGDVTPAPISFAPVIPGEDPCEDIPQFEQKCDDTPSQIVLRYTGNDCDVSSNQQGDLFFCRDFQGGPTTEGCMVVRDIRGGETVYYDGPVDATDGMNIVLNAESVGDTEIEPNMNVTIYRDCDTQKEPQDILETMVFHTSCSENLFLRDTFGSIEIVGFENGEQGSVTCENTEPPIPSPTDAPVAPPTDAPVEPTDAPVEPPTDAPVEPPTDAPVEPPTDAPVDATPAPVPATRAPVVVLETESPSDIPTESPTPEEVEDPCEDIPPFVTQCDDTPTQLAIRYTGGDCDDSENLQMEGDGLFFCEDFQGGPTEEACMVVTDIRGGSTVYYDDIVDASTGEPIILSTEGTDDFLEPNMNVTIYSDCDSKNPEDILETLVFHTSCSETLFLKDVFGSIEIIGFENNEQGKVDCVTTPAGKGGKGGKGGAYGKKGGSDSEDTGKGGKGGPYGKKGGSDSEDIGKGGKGGAYGKKGGSDSEDTGKGGKGGAYGKKGGSDSEDTGKGGKGGGAYGKKGGSESEDYGKGGKGGKGGSSKSKKGGMTKKGKGKGGHSSDEDEDHDY